MRLYYTDHFVLLLPPGHRFPMDKYRRLRERTVALGGFGLREPEAVSDDQLALAHDRDYIERVASGRMDPREVRALGFPWSRELVERSRRSTGATVAAARTALTDGAAGNLAGGTHHAGIASAQGFCVFNDCAVAARVLQQEGRIRRALIVDTDVHQGNGSAGILAGDDSVFTFSIHGARNFPVRKETSDLDVALADDTADAPYLEALDAALAESFERARPELVFHLAGADAFAGDRLGRLALTKAGLAERDRFVVERCSRNGVPAVIVMGGGYAPDVEDIVDIHCASIERVATLTGRVVATARDGLQPMWK